MVIKNFTLAIACLIILSQTIVNASTLSKEIQAFPIKTLSGENITLKQYIGKQPVYLKFWASWCAPCRKQMPHFQKVQDEYGDKIKVIGINLGINDDIQHVNATIKEFKLTMSTTVDATGELAQAVELIGTPFHVLIDKEGNIVHKGFDASEELDKKIQLLITNKTDDLSPVVSSSISNNGITINKTKTTALFFLATWCDWYLKDKRPAMSNDCITAQNTINALYKQFPTYDWLGVASRLWTGDKDLQEYKKKFNITHPISIDTSNKIFLDYKVFTFPTLVIVKNGKELLRVTNFNNQKELKNTLHKLTN